MTDAPLNKHQQKTAATKDKLLRAARRVFSRDGFEAARIDDIAIEAGYTRGAFYAHFETKEDLFFALLEERASAHLNGLRVLLESCTSDHQRLECLRDFYVARASDKQWSILMLEFKLYALRHGKLRAKLAAAHRNIRAKMKLEEIGLLLPVELRRESSSRELLKSALEGILSGIVLERAYDPTRVSQQQVESILRELFDAIIRSPATRTAT